MEKHPYILITGASSGIGKAIAMTLSDTHSLILHGRNEARLNETLKACSCTDNHLFWSFDLSNSSETAASLTELIQQKELCITGFIHCAGHLRMNPLRAVSVQSIQDSINVNFLSAALIIKTLINKKLNAGALSNIVFISSTASVMGSKAFSIYSATKGALDAFMRCLAVELAPDIRVNSVLPGAIQTEMTTAIFENKDLIDRMKADYPLGFGRPSDIAEMVSFLISEKSRWITGQQLIVDGGRSINITG